MWSQVRLRQTLSEVGGDLICLAVELPFVSVPQGWNWRLSGTAKQWTPRGPGSYHGGGGGALLLPSVCLTAINTEAIRDRVLLQPRRATLMR